MQTIFVVEDDENIRELAVYALNSAGFSAFGFEDGLTFFNKLASAKPELVILDIMLPDDDGLSILKKIRANPETAALPVIMLTAKDSEYDRVKGLNLGADDSIVKPFFVLELIARVKALLRRFDKKAMQPELAYKNIRLDIDKHLATLDGSLLNLTLKEFELLHYLLLNAGLVLSRDKIISHIWGYDYESESRTVDMHIKSLRQKLGASGEMIKTIRGVGYKLGD